MRESPNPVTITRDTFLDVLGFSKVREKLKERDKIDLLYISLLNFLNHQNEAKTVELPKSTGTRELDLKIPGMPVHINLSKFLLDKIESFVTAWLIIQGASQNNPVQAGAAVIIGLMNKLTLLQKQYGELCAVESLAEVVPKSSESVCLNLYGKPCRYPQAACQFLKEKKGTCNFDRTAMRQTIEALEKKGVVEKINAVEPVLWRVTL